MRRSIRRPDILRDVVFGVEPYPLARSRGAAREPLLPPVRPLHVAVPPPLDPQPQVSIAELELRCEQARTAGYRQGYDEGSEAGRRHGCEEGGRAAREAQDAAHAASRAEAAEHEAALQQRSERLDELLAGVGQALAKRLEAIEDDLVALAFEAVCSVVAERACDAGAVRAYLAKAVATFARNESVVAHLHPDDVRLLREGGADAGEPSIAGIRLLPDPSITPGGCVLRSAEGGLDARLETRLGGLRERLLQCRAEGRADVAG